MRPARQVLVVGDVMLDRTLLVRPMKIASEAPSLVVKHLDSELALGGAANVAANVSHMECAICLLGLVGDDWAGRQIFSLCESLPYFTNQTVVDRNVSTVVKTRVSADGVQLLRIDEEHPLHNKELALRFRKFVTVTPPDVIVVSDYAKGTCNDALIHDIADYSRLCNIPVLIDAKDLSRYRDLGAIATPNLAEAMRHVDHICHPGLAVNDPIENGLTAARLIIETLGYSHVVVTLGARGAASAQLVNGALEIQYFPALDIRGLLTAPVDVTGAGDVFIAGLAAAGCNVDGIKYAVVAAGLSVTRSGTAVIKRPEILAALESYNVAVIGDPK